MATSGTIYGSVTKNSNHFSFYATWLAAQNVEGNFSEVTVRSYWKCVNTSYYTFDTVAARSASIKVTTAAGTLGSKTISQAFDLNPWPSNPYLIQTLTVQVPHNADGTAPAINIEARANGTAASYGPSSSTSSSGDCVAVDFVTLDTIPRASQPSCVTWPEHTQNVGSFGDTISIHMNRNASAFTHTVRYAYGNLSGTIATGVTTGCTWTIPLSFMDLIPSATSGSGTIYVDTYQGSTLIGTKYCGFTASVPASVKPTCTVQVLDGTDNITKYGNLVKGWSTLHVVVRGYPAYSSPVSSYNATANGSTYTSAEFTTGVLTAAGTTTVSATVKDKRGRTSAAASASFTVLDYSAPKVTALSVHRCDEDGTPNEQGDYVKAVFSASVTSLNNKNSAAYKLRYKKTTGSDYQEIALSNLNKTYTVTNYSYVFAAEGNSSYNVEVQAVDDFQTASRATSASTAFTLMNWGADGTSMAIGKVAEKSRTLEVGLQFELSGGILPLEISDEEDLNADKYKVSGWYRCSLSGTAASLINCPTDKAFVMEVLPNVPATQRITEYVEHSSPRIFLRNYYDYVNKWGEWYELVPRHTRIGTVEDLTTYSYPYTFPSDGYLILRAHYSAGSYINCTISGSNGKGFMLSATSGDYENLKGNPTDALFVRKGMIMSAVDTNDSGDNALLFYPLY